MNSHSRDVAVVLDGLPPRGICAGAPGRLFTVAPRPRFRRQSAWNLAAAIETCEIRILPAATTVRVDDFGADPTGRTYSTLAIQAAIDAAGPGGTVIFTRNATYLNFGMLTPHHANQTWIGNNATIRRCDAVSTAIQSSIGTEARQTTMTVADANRFRVGMQVTVFSGSQYDPHNHTVLAINGNEITVGTRFVQSFSAGATLVTSFEQVSHQLGLGLPDGLTIESLKFDGNRQNNTLISRWQLHSELYLSATNMTLRNLTATNAQAEGFKIGGENVSLFNLTVTNSNGNGIHFSGIHHYTADKLTVQNANLLGTAPGHADGGVIWSNQTEHGTLTRIYVENAIAGLGSIDSPDNSYLDISDVTVINCGTIVDMRTPGVAVHDVSIRNLRSRNDSSIAVVAITNSQGLQPNSGPSNIQLSGWYCENAILQIRGGRDIDVTSSQFKVRLASTAAVANIEISENVSVAATLQGARYGFVASVGCCDVVFRGIATNNNLAGIVLGQGTNVWADRGRVIAYRNLVNDAQYVGAILSNGTRLLGGKFELLTGTAGVVMPAGLQGVGNSGAIVDGVIIQTPKNVTAVRLTASSQNNRVQNNRSSTLITDPSGGRNFLLNNRVL